MSCCSWHAAAPSAPRWRSTWSSLAAFVLSIHSVSSAYAGLGPDFEMFDGLGSDVVRGLLRPRTLGGLPPDAGRPGRSIGTTHRAHRSQNAQRRRSSTRSSSPLAMRLRCCSSRCPSSHSLIKSGPSVWRRSDGSTWIYSCSSRWLSLLTLHWTLRSPEHPVVAGALVWNDDRALRRALCPDRVERQGRGPGNDRRAQPRWRCTPCCIAETGSSFT